MTTLRTLVGVCFLFAVAGLVIFVPLALGWAVVLVVVTTVTP